MKLIRAGEKRHWISLTVNFGVPRERPHRILSDSAESPCGPDAVSVKLGSACASIAPAATATNEQHEANHVADDKRRAHENRHIPLGGQMRDGSRGGRMRERHEGVERAD